jgi:hypothetical protein
VGWKGAGADEDDDEEERDRERERVGVAIWGKSDSLPTKAVDANELF